MLPNWLYGKSKSKLANILGGGGGIPEDYNQVKAQVTQNTEGIELLDTSSQTLTSQANSMGNVLGAKNLLPNNAIAQTLTGLTVIINSDGSITLNGTTTAAWGLMIIGTTFKKGKYILSDGGASIFGSIRLQVINQAQSGVIAETNDSHEKEFDLLTDMFVYVRIFWNSDVTVDNLTFYPMIRPASITDGTYVPYAMTNRELTEKLTADANLGTAIDLSTYAAYSNMYTAPSDGYVHFQSAASGSQQRTIYTYGNNTTAATDSHFTHSTSVNNKAFEIFIKKGLKIYADGLQTGDTINFYPLI